MELNNNDRVEQLANTESFRNLKDHEPNLYAYPQCCLFNPGKGELVKLSKCRLGKKTNFIEL